MRLQLKYDRHENEVKRGHQARPHIQIDIAFDQELVLVDVTRIECRLPAAQICEWLIDHACAWLRAPSSAGALRRDLSASKISVGATKDSKCTVTFQNRMSSTVHKLKYKVQ